MEPSGSREDCEACVISNIETPGTYGGLVDAELVREALNLQDNAPSNAALIFRIEESAQRIESLTRLVLAESVWNYYADAADLTANLITIPGLFAVGQDPTVAVTDDDGGTVAVTSTILGTGDELRIEPSAGTFAQLALPLTVQITRGVTKDHLPGDLRMAVITMIEQITDGFSPIAENSIIRACSRYGWVG